MKLLKRCPLTVLLAVSAFLLTVTAYANRDGIYGEYRNGQTPALAMLFEGAKDGVFPWSREPGDALLTMADAAVGEDPGDGAGAGAENAAPSPDDGEGPVPEDGGETGETDRAAEPKEEQAEPEESVSPEDAAASEGEEGPSEAQEEGPVQAEGEDPGAVPEGQEPEAPEEGGVPWTEEARDENATYEYVPVDESYLDDALFIGDSRTQGLFEYGGLEDHATFYCKTSLTIYDLFKNQQAFIRTESGNQTLEQALSARQFGKIYLMLGINEMGTGTPESFFTEYAKAVLKIRELQPNAILFVQGIMHVAAKKNASDPIFNNFNIDVRNVEIQTLEDKRDIFYLDVNEVVCDENGNLFDGWTFDQIHLKGKYYQIWKDFLLQHGIVREQG